MEKIGETVSRLCSTSTLKATVDEIRTLFRPSTAKAIADPSTTPESRKLALEEKLASLTRLSRMIIRQKNKIDQAVDDVEKEALKTEDELLELELPDISPPVLIQFVDVMEQANQYFDFKEIVKAACRDLEPTLRPAEISRTLLLNRRLLSDFSKIGELQITQVSDAIFSELHYEQRGKKHTKWSKPQKKDPARIDWIHDLVYKTRLEGYVMDQDPKAELKKMMKLKPYFYDNYFLGQQLPVKCTERMVKEACSKYSDLVSIMVAKYKETSSEKNLIASTASEMDMKSKRPFVMTGDDHGSPEKRRKP